jgi:hypothetical protein
MEKGIDMTFQKLVGSLLSTAVLGGVMATTGVLGCEVHAGYYYDPYDHRYYAPDQETVYYMQWENETHRRHEEWKHRRDNERREYWQWRHQHEHDRDRDRDRDKDRR